MATIARYTRRTLPSELASMEAWPHFDTASLSPEDLGVWRRRRDAVASYLGGEAVSVIEARYGYQCHQVVLYLNRCVRVLDDGSLAGWIGLVKGIRTGATARKSPLGAMPHLSRGGYVGALEYTFSTHPSIKLAMDMYLATGIEPSGRDGGRVTQRKAHQVFLRLCKDAGIGQREWPFCVERQGRNSLGKYVQTFFKQNHQKVALLQFGQACRDRSKRGKAPLEKIGARAPFEIVEADEHEAHVIISVGIETPKGLKYVPCQRLTLILAVDRFTNHILAWDLVLRRQITSADFLECMDRAVSGQCLSPEVKSILLASSGDEGNQSGRFQLGFDTLFVDNALAHLSDAVCNTLCQEAGAAVTFGAINRPERRGLVEHVFSWLGAEVYHRSSATTGNSPVDTRRNNPEKQAVRKRLTLSEITKATEDAVTLWNNRPTEANYGDSPAAQLLDYYSSIDGALSPLCPPRPYTTPPMRAEISCPTVRGSQAKGRAPSISCASVEYSSPELAGRWDLVGKKIRVHADPYDVSSVRAYTAEGEGLGELAPISSRWRYPHSREMRRLLKLSIKHAHDRLDQNPIDQALGALEEQALEANAKAPRATCAASTVAEERRKGYASDSGMARTRPSVRISTKQLAERIRKPSSIDFSVIGKS